MSTNFRIGCLEAESKQFLSSIGTPKIVLYQVISITDNLVVNCLSHIYAPNCAIQYHLVRNITLQNVLVLFIVKTLILQIIAKLKNRMLLFFKVWRRTICAGLFFSKLHLTAKSDNEIEHVKKAFILYCKAYVYEMNWSVSKILLWKWSVTLFSLRGLNHKTFYSSN